MKQILLLVISVLTFFTILCSSENAQASHAMGADLTYECIGPNQYRIRLSFYRDCGGILPSSTFSLNYSSASCAQNLTATLNLLPGYPVEVSPLCVTQIVNSRCNGGTLPGVQQYIYEGVITLPMACTDWVFSIREGNRNIAINTIVSPDFAFLYVESRLNNINAPCNNSPTFSNLPVPYVCLGQPLLYNHGAVDVDGDSLYYNLVACLDDAGSPVTYMPGFSATSPFSSSTAITIDHDNGNISATPSAIQVGVFAVRVDEYRDGVLIGSVTRDIQITIISCTNNIPVLSNYLNVSGGVLTSPTEISTCVGNNLSFMVTGSDADITDSLSVLTNLLAALPGSTYSIRGRNPDTVFVNWVPSTTDLGFNSFTISVRDNHCPIVGLTTRAYDIVVAGVRITTSDTIILCASSASSIGLSATGSISGYTWSVISGDFSSLTCATCNPSMVSPTTTTTYRVVGTAPTGCPTSDTVTVIIVPFFSVNSISDTTICAGRSVLLNTTRAGLTSGITYTWTPSTGLSSSSILSPVATPSVTTTYVLQAAFNGCYSYDTVNIVVNPSPIVDATISPANYCNGDTLTFNAYIPDNPPRCDTYNVAPIAHAPIAGSGINVVLGDDQVSSAIPLGFNFNFFCNNYNNIYISSNGFVTFNATSGSGCCAGGVIPSTDGINDVIALFWNDLYPPLGGTIEYFITGVAPNRRFVISFNTINHCCSAGATNTGQIVLYETSNIIDLYLTNVTDDGSVHTAGIENSTETLGFPVPGRNSTNWTTTNEAWRFTPIVVVPAPYIYSWSPTAGLFPRLDTAVTNHIVTSARSFYVTVSRNGCSTSDTVNVAPRLDVSVTPDTTICAGMPVQLNASINYDTIPTIGMTRCDSYIVATIPFAPNTGSGTNVVLGDDQVSSAIPLGFNFNFFCNNYNNIYISSNGFATFNPSSGAGCCAGGVIPSVDAINDVISLFWNDLYPPLGGSINYFITGIAPNRMFIINFNAINHCCSAGATNTGQIILYESSNIIDLYLTNVTDDGSVHTAGIENSAGTLGYPVPGRNSSNWTTSNEAWRFTPIIIPPSFIPVSYTWTPTTGLSSTTILNPIATPTTNISYIITATAGTCIDSDTATITIRARDSIVITRNICSNQTYLFNGVNLNIAGTYLDTLTNSSGCDSLVTLNLIVNPTRTGILSQSICSGSSYLFNGINRTTAGTYLDTLVTSNGCDSFLTLNLTIRSTTTGTINQSICAGSSYLFNGINRTTAGTYLDTLLGSNGCDSFLTLNLSLWPLSDTTYQYQTTCFDEYSPINMFLYLNIYGCDSVNVVYTTYIPPITTFDTLYTCDISLVGNNEFYYLSYTGCDSIVFQTTLLLLSTTGTINQSICAGSSYLFNGINRTTAGSYLDTLVGSNGCDSFLTLNLTIRPITTGTINQSICAGSSFLFNGINRTTAGSYLDTLVGSNGCDSFLTLNLTIRSTTTGTINQSICSGSSYLFNGINRTTAGSYIDTLVGSNGCDSFLTLNLTIRPITTGTINQCICAGSSYLFNGINRSTAGSYLDTLVGSNGCDSFLTLNLTIRSTTTGTINQNICSGSSYLFNGINRTTAGSYLDTLVGSNGCDSFLTLNLSLWPLSDTTYQYQTTCFDEYSPINMFLYLNIYGCDSVNVVYTTYIPPITTFDTLYTCDISLVGNNEFYYLSYTGCDSIVFQSTLLLLSTTGTINQSICAGSSYLFNGINRTTAGSYLDTLVGSNGCDSIVTLNLIINLLHTTSSITSSCNPADTGVIITTLSNIYGCDSVHTITTTLLPSHSTSEALTTCDPLEVGVDEHSYTNIYGCDSIHTVTTILLPSSNTSAIASSCNLADTGVIITTLTNIYGCDSVHTITTTLLPSQSTSEALTTCDPLEVGVDEHSYTNIYGCDSIHTVTTTLLPSSNTSAITSSCNPADTGVIITTLNNIYGCDSVHTITTTLLPTQSTSEALTTCDPLEVGVDEHSYTNIYGCDSIHTITTTLLPSSSTSAIASSCNPADTGILITTLSNIYGCDSVHTVTTTLLPTQSTSEALTTCDPLEVGVDEHSYTNIYGCDSIHTITTTLLPSSTTSAIASSCNPADTGVIITTLTNIYGCDSVHTITTTLLPSQSTSEALTTCNPLEVGIDEHSYTNIYGCDSIHTITTTLLPSSTTSAIASSCNPADTGIVITTLSNIYGCDSVHTITTTLLPTQSTSEALTKCDPLEVGVDEHSYTNIYGCDSVHTITTTLLPIQSTSEALTTCDPLEVGVDEHSYTNIYGCDSIHTITTTLLPSSNTSAIASSCNPADTGIIITTLSNIYGCDSIHTVTTTLLPSINTSVITSSCNPADTGVVITTLSNIYGCDSVHTITTTLLPRSNTSAITSSCNPADTGIVITTLSNIYGCDSIHTITTTLLPSSSTSAIASSCNPADTGIVITTLSNIYGCDSVHTITTTLLPSQSTSEALTTCDPLEVGVDEHSYTNIYGCDSVHTITTTLLPSSTTSAIASSCNPADTGIVITTLNNIYGCDSIHTITTTLLPSSNTSAITSSCNPADTGIVITTLNNIYGCDSVHTITTTLLPSSTTSAIASSCNLADTGIVITTLSNIYGCDSVHTITTTLLPSHSTSEALTTCDPLEVGVDEHSYTNIYGCDSIHTVTTTLLPSSSTSAIASSCNPADTGVIITTLTNIYGCDSSSYSNDNIITK
jgi:hypothetical protein